MTDSENPNRIDCSCGYMLPIEPRWDGSVRRMIGKLSRHARVNPALEHVVTFYSEGIVTSSGVLRTEDASSHGAADYTTP